MRNLLKSVTISFFLPGVVFLLFPACSIVGFGFIDYDSPRFRIMGSGISSPAQMTTFLRKHNAGVSPRQAQMLAKLYIEESRREGVNHDLAFAQMCLETGYLKFNGIVKKHQFNFAGLGAINRWTSGARFSSPQQGVRAHIQHLKAYATTAEFNNRSVDPRLKMVRRGCCPTIFELPGRWASDSQYARKIAKLLDRLYDIR